MRTYSHDISNDLPSMRSLVPPSEIFQMLLGGLTGQCDDDQEHSNVTGFQSGQIVRQGFETQSKPHFFIASTRPIPKGTLLVNGKLECELWTTNSTRYIS